MPPERLRQNFRDVSTPEYARGSVWEVELSEKVGQVEEFGDHPSASEDYLGFRLVREVEEKPCKKKN